MKISTKGRYALRLLADLAEHGGDGFVSLNAASVRQGISKKYLEQIVPLLSNSGILYANRGAQGGYKMAISPAECTVGEVLRLTEGSLAPVACLEGERSNCDRSDSCDVHYIWQGLYDVVTNYLDRLTVQDILDRKRRIANRDDIVLL